MKKLLIFLLAVLCLTLVSCGKEYEPVKSTEEEARVVYTMFLDGEVYVVRYELYRAFFLNNKSLVDGGDDSVWSSADAERYISEINEIIFDRIGDIYAVFSFAKSLDINPYSAVVEDTIYDYIVLSVEGNGGDIKGHGSYERFLVSLKEENMNYAVMELLLRYSIVYSLISEEYNGVTDEVLGQLPGNIEISRDEVFSYYMGDECARVLQMVCPDYEKMQEHKSRLAEKKTDKERALYIINQSTALHTDCIVDKEISGVIVGKYATDSTVYGEYTDKVFSLSVGASTDIVAVNDGTRTYYLAYKLEKTEEHFDRCYDAIKQSYIDNELGRRLESIKGALVGSIELYEAYNGINHSRISMD